MIYCFERLLVERLNDSRRHTSSYTPPTAAAALMGDLTQAIEDASATDVAKTQLEPPYPPDHRPYYCERMRDSDIAAGISNLICALARVSS